MSTTTTPPAPTEAGAPSGEPTDRPRITIPGFARARELLAASPASESPGPDAMTPREPGTSPGPGRTPIPTTPATEANADYHGESAEQGDGPPGGFGTPRPGRLGRPTSSSTGEVGAKELAAAIAGVLFVLAGFTAWAVSRRGRLELRVPDEQERLAVARPLSRIVDRHVGAAFLTPDLVDGVAAASGVAAYASTSPLQRTDRSEPAVEDPFDEDLEAHGYAAP